MLYNGAQYDGGEYNGTLSVLGLAESLSSADSLNKSISLVKVEAQPSMDALSDAETLAAFLDTITILQHATYGHVYNSAEYNAAMYNRTADQDEVLLQATKALVDAITSSDALAPFSASKLLSETISEAVAIFFTQNPVLSDFVFMTDDVRPEISNKALTDTIRVNDWLEFTHTPFTEYWGQ